MSNFGKNVYKYRKLAGLTQDELAQILGYKNKASIGKIETGVAEVPVSMAPKLMQQMEACKIDYKALGLSFHSFRHFFNTQLVANNVEQNKILAVIGHTSVKMTQHYLHLEAGDLGQIRAVQTAI